MESAAARLPRATIHTTANAITRSASCPIEGDPESAVLVEGSTLGVGTGVAVGVGVGATVGLAVGATVGVAVATATGVPVGATVEVTGRSTRNPMATSSTAIRSPATRTIRLRELGFGFAEIWLTSASHRRFVCPANDSGNPGRASLQHASGANVAAGLADVSVDFLGVTDDGQAPAC